MFFDDPLLILHGLAQFWAKHATSQHADTVICLLGLLAGIISLLSHLCLLSPSWEADKEKDRMEVALRTNIQALLQQCVDLTNDDAIDVESDQEQPRPKRLRGDESTEVVDAELNDS